MKMQFPLCPGGRVVEVEGATHADLFRELSGAVEVFGETHCGACGGDAIVPIARTAQEFEFFEWACLDPKCGARLSLGVRKDKSGRLFPKRRLLPNGKPDMDNGEPGTHRGWTRYHGDADTGSAGPKTPPPTQRSNGGTTAPATATKATGKPAAPPPTDAGARITAEQWSEIQTELRRHFIADRAFLERHGYQSPREILAAHFAEALAAAKAPDDELRAIQKRLKLAER